MVRLVAGNVDQAKFCQRKVKFHKLFLTIDKAICISGDLDNRVQTYLAVTWNTGRRLFKVNSNIYSILPNKLANLLVFWVPNKLNCVIHGNICHDVTNSKARPGDSIWERLKYK